MALKTRARHLAKKADYAASGISVVDLPQDNLLRRLNLHLRVNVASGATIPVGIKNGDYLNLIKRIQVRINGTDSVFDLDLRTYFGALRMEYGTVTQKDSFSIPSANQNSNFDCVIPVDFAFIRDQISDFSALLPAPLVDSLELLITWGTIDDIVTTKNTASIGATTQVGISIIEVYETEGTSKALDDVIANLTRIYEGVEETGFTSAYSSYPADELPVEVRPVPARHLSAMIIGIANDTDNDPAYANDVITQIKLENVKGGGELLFHGYFDDLQRGQKADLHLENNLNGAVYMDWADIRNGGLSNVDVDALKYKFLTNAPASGKTDAVRIYKKFIPLG